MRFPLLSRYLAKSPVLVTATIPRESIIALKLGRREQEVIALHGIAKRIVSVERIKRPDKMDFA